MSSKSQQAADAAASNEELPGVAPQQPPEIPQDVPGEDVDKVKTQEGGRLNLVRFLQERPQSGGIRALLNAKHRTSVMTMAEWESALAGLLNKKTK